MLLPALQRSPIEYAVCVSFLLRVCARACMDMPTDLPFAPFLFLGLVDFSLTLSVPSSVCLGVYSPVYMQVSRVSPRLPLSLSLSLSRTLQLSVHPSICPQHAELALGSVYLSVLSPFLSLLFSHCLHTPQTNSPPALCAHIPQLLLSQDLVSCFLSLKP